MMNRETYYHLQDAIDFVTDGNISELSELSSDKSDHDEIADKNFSKPDNQRFSSEESDISDDILLSSLIPGSSTNTSVDKSGHSNVGHTYSWRKKDTMVVQHIFKGAFSDPPLNEDITPLSYFQKFITPKLIDEIVAQTNLYSFQKKHKNIKTSPSEIMVLIVMSIKMGIVSLSSYANYWSRELRYPPVAEIISRNRYQELIRYLHFVDNTTIDKRNKVGKIKLLIEAVRNECIKIEPEEFQNIEEQIIPSKTKFSSIRQYNPKKTKKWGFKNLVRASSCGLMHKFYVYEGKNNINEESENDYSHLPKSAQVVARLSKDLSGGVNLKLFFDNWFSKLDL